MARYIDAEKVEKWLHRDDWGTPDARWRPEEEFGKMIDSMPTEDVAPIIHGHWYFDETDYITRCSACECGKWKGYIPSVEEAKQWMPFCPQCGAKMDEEVKQ